MANLTKITVKNAMPKRQMYKLCDVDIAYCLENRMFHIGAHV